MRVIIDRYGEDIPTRIYDAEHFVAEIEADLSGSFFGWVFQFMGKIKILSPQECVEEMRRIAQLFL